MPSKPKHDKGIAMNLDNVIELIEYQDSEFVTLMCTVCEDVFYYEIPFGMPLHILECDMCMSKDCMTDKVPRDRL